MTPLPHQIEPDPVTPDQEMLSAWMDGELDSEQAQILIDRLKRDEALRVRFEWLQVASDAMQSHEVAACHVPQLARKVGLALEAEPALLAPRALSGAGLRRHLATGMTLAAAAALLAVVALPQLRGSGAVAPPSSSGPVVASRAGDARIAAPQVVESLAAPNPQLDAYFRAHRELETTGVMPAAVAYIRSSGEPDR